jgi:hypothetical protein
LFSCGDGVHGTAPPRADLGFLLAGSGNPAACGSGGSSLVTGAGAVVALVLLEWTTGWMGAAAWSQSWAVVHRGHFRVLAWGAVGLGALGVATAGAAISGDDSGAVVSVGVMLVALCVAYLVVQRSRTDRPGAIVGAGASAAGLATLIAGAALLDNWGVVAATLQLTAGAALLGAVTNGMLLGHWYLNQPGLKPWALGRLTTLSLGALATALGLGLAFAGPLSGASTEGAAFGLEGFGESFGVAFYAVWLALMVVTGAVVWMARRCVRIHSIQSATGLYYVALLTAGVAEFLIRYLMVNAS